MMNRMATILGGSVLAALLGGCAPGMQAASVQSMGTYEVPEGTLILTGDRDLIRRECNRETGCYVQAKKTIICSSSELEICGQELFRHMGLIGRAS